MEHQFMMISAASRVLQFMNPSPMAMDEEIYQDLSDYIESERVGDEKVIQGMIAAGSIALKLKRKSGHKITDKQILQEIMKEIPRINDELQEEL